MGWFWELNFEVRGLKRFDFPRIIGSRNLASECELIEF